MNMGATTEKYIFQSEGGEPILYQKIKNMEWVYSIDAEQRAC